MVNETKIHIHNSAMDRKKVVGAFVANICTISGLSHKYLVSILCSLFLCIHSSFVCSLRPKWIIGCCCFLLRLAIIHSVCVHLGVWSVQHPFASVCLCKFFGINFAYVRLKRVTYFKAAVLSHNFLRYESHKFWALNMK